MYSLRGFFVEGGRRQEWGTGWWGRSAILTVCAHFVVQWPQVPCGYPKSRCQARGFLPQGGTAALRVSMVFVV
ncbi:hypothetical protein K370107A2_16650 [Merdimmobilis hominis]